MTASRRLAAATLVALVALAAPAGAADEVALECGALEAEGVHAFVSGDLDVPAELSLSAKAGERRWSVLPSHFHPDSARLSVTRVAREPAFLHVELRGEDGAEVALRLAALPDERAQLYAGVLVVPGAAYVVKCVDLTPPAERP